jgi:Xaa-Pro aminopeptidase
VTVPPVPVPGSAAEASATTSAASEMTPPVPLAGFAPEEFQARRRTLRQSCPAGILLIRGATEEEVAKPCVFQQNSAFFYLTGVETPGAFLVMLPEGLPAGAGLRSLPANVRELLFLPARNTQTELWMGPRLGPGEETEKRTGIEKVVDAGGLWNALMAWLRRDPGVVTVTPYGEQAQTTREYALMQHIARLAPAAQFRDIAPYIAPLRLLKSPAEIERITQAIAITAEGQKAARELIASGAGRYEYEVEAAVLQAFRSRGARQAFAAIVGGGRNATVLHYEDNHDVLKEGELVVVDIGAEVDHYCGDLTRTYAVGGTMTPRQQDIYDLVRAAFDRVIADYKPGEDSLKSLDDRCKAFLDESPLRALDADGKEQTMKTFMPHGLSHHLGLDVHDLVQIADRESPLQPDNVITVEPGIYIASESIGVRLEHDFLVTETGMQRLGPDLDM